MTEQEYGEYKYKRGLKTAQNIVSKEMLRYCGEDHQAELTALYEVDFKIEELLNRLNKKRGKNET